MLSYFFLKQTFQALLVFTHSFLTLVMLLSMDQKNKNNFEPGQDSKLVGVSIAQNCDLEDLVEHYFDGHTRLNIFLKWNHIFAILPHFLYWYLIFGLSNISNLQMFTTSYYFKFRYKMNIVYSCWYWRSTFPLIITERNPAISKLSVCSENTFLVAAAFYDWFVQALPSLSV